MKRYLEPELKNFKKKTLTAICDTLNLYLTSNNKKERQIECIIQKFCELLNNGKKNGLAEEVVIDTILGKISHPEQLFPQILRKALLSYLDNVKAQGAQPPQMFIQMKRPVGVTLEDTKDTHMCLCLGSILTPSTIACSICMREYHQECIRIPANEVFECPYCFIQDMDPIHEVVETLFTGYVRAEDTIHNFRFSLKEADLSNPRHQVEMRCIRLDGKNNYELTWPDYGYVKLNENKIADFKPLINNSSLKRRKDEPKIVERRMLRSIGDNFAQMTVMPPQLKEQVRISVTNHMVGIFVIKLNTPNEVVERLRHNIISEQESRQILLEQMSPLDEITIERLDVSLECVFSMEPIRIPVRSKECRHFNCFDLNMMVTTTTKSQPRRWRCPICKRKAHRLVVDPILTNIIQENQPKLLAEVSFMPDLTYKVTEEKVDSEKEESELERPAKQTGPIICLDDEDSHRGNPMPVPSPLDYQHENLHDGLSFEPNPFMVEDMCHQSIDKQSHMQMEVEPDRYQVENPAMSLEQLIEPLNHRERDYISGMQGSRYLQNPPIPLAQQRSNDSPDTQLRRLTSGQLERANDQTIAAIISEKSIANNQFNPSSQPITMEPERRPPQSYYPEPEKHSESRPLRASRPIGSEHHGQDTNMERKMPMPFEIITPNPMPQQNPYQPMRPPYFMPPTVPPTGMGMSMMPPHSRFPPPPKGAMYPPYGIPPYYNYFGMRGDMPPGPMQRPRFDDPSMYMQMPPEYPHQDYSMHHMRQMPPSMSHLQHLQHMAALAPPYGPHIAPPPHVSQNPQMRGYQPAISQASTQPPYSKAVPPQPQQPPKYNPALASKLSQSTVTPTAGKTMEKKISTTTQPKSAQEKQQNMAPPSYYKTTQMRNIQQPISSIPTRASQSRMASEPASASNRHKEVIEIIDSQEQTEEQKNEQRAKEQWAKLNQLNLQSLKTAVNLTDKEKSSLLEILQSYEETQSAQ